ncbi:MAG: hypothetical protein IIC21_09190, partial [Chloroflexi bacterium]|nr:hypothetical protein [Chloroflexota bacterium]
RGRLSRSLSDISMSGRRRLEMLMRLSRLSDRGTELGERRLGRDVVIHHLDRHPDADLVERRASLNIRHDHLVQPMTPYPPQLITSSP